MAVPSFADFMEDEILDHILNDGSYTAPTTWYCKLSTTIPTEANGNFTEPTSNSYSPVATTAATWSASSGGAKTNGTAITFAQATGSWGTIVYANLEDSGTATGNCLGLSNVDPDKAIATNDTAEFAAGDFDFTLD